MGTLARKLLSKKKSPPMHFVSRYDSRETMCGKSAPHTRCAYTFVIWDNPGLAGGRRCPVCAPGVEAMRADTKAGA